MKYEELKRKKSKIREESKEPEPVKDMAPKLTSKGVQDYANPKGQSYAARKGFVG